MPRRRTDPSTVGLDAGEFIAVVPVELSGRDARSVRKSLTIPAWLDEAARREGLHFSAVLREALMSKLGF